jgi:hypothetical protein
MEMEMILGLGVLAVFVMMWVILPSRFHRKHEADEE